MAAKKSATKAAATKGASAKSSPSKAGGSRAKGATKSEIYAHLAEKTDLTKKDIARVFDALSELIARELSKKGPGQFTVPGLLRLKVVHKPATKEREGIDPFTKQPRVFKAKPATNVVRAKPLKALRDLV